MPREEPLKARNLWVGELDRPAGNGIVMRACDRNKRSIQEKHMLLRPQMSIAFVFQEITLTKYILKNINIYDT